MTHSRFLRGMLGESLYAPSLGQDARVCVTVRSMPGGRSLALVWRGVHFGNVPFPEEPWVLPDETAFRDHDPNPDVVRRFAASVGFAIAPEAWEVMRSRWEDGC